MSIGISKSLLISIGNVNANVGVIFSKFVDFFERDLIDRSPVDKGDYKSSWTTESNGNFSSTISNSMPYGEPLEFGSIQGSSPWPNPGPKTVLSNGRIFSSQSPNGAIEKTFSKSNIDMFVRDLTIAVMKGFKDGL